MSDNNIKGSLLPDIDPDINSSFLSKHQTRQYDLNTFKLLINKNFLSLVHIELIKWRLMLSFIFRQSK